MKRLPIHPRPLPHESLSSWVERLATPYDLPAWTFMERAFGYSLSGRELDTAPPAGLLLTISERTGVPVGKLHGMTLAGYVPLLLDTVTPAKGLFETYISQYPVLAPIRERFRRPIFRLDEATWLPWVLPDSREHPPFCRQCVMQDTIPYRRIYWRVAWMTCCPVHQEMLEVGFLSRYHRKDDLYAFTPRRTASEELVVLDELTLQAVTEGSVMLPNNRRINAAVWVRALRTLLDELIRPQYTLADARAIITTAWEVTGRSLHQGLGMGRVLEDMTASRREEVFAVAAATVVRLLNGSLETESRTVFVPSPAPHHQDLPSLPPPAETQTDAAADWEGLWAAAVDAAKRSPLQAYKLRQLMIWRLPASQIDGVDLYLRDLGIPVVTTQPAT